MTARAGKARGLNQKTDCLTLETFITYLITGLCYRNSTLCNTITTSRKSYTTKNKRPAQVMLCHFNYLFVAIEVTGQKLQKDRTADLETLHVYGRDDGVNSRLASSVEKPSTVKSQQDPVPYTCWAKPFCLKSHK